MSDIFHAFSRKVLSGALLPLVGVGTAALAQGVEEVVVTAQRRAEVQQDVPIAITTLTARALESAGIGSTDALEVMTPGLVMTRQAKGSTPFIRGVGSRSVIPGNESPVAMYVDGVYYMSPMGNIFSFNNIERIEVLKGPQGTLFGRNSTGGLIHAVTRDPSAAPEVKISASYGNYNTREWSAYATAGTDAVAADIALFSTRNDGYGKALTTGKRINKVDERAVRSKVIWRATDATSVVLSADWSNNRGDIGVSRNALKGALLLGGLPLNGDLYDAQVNTMPKVDSDYWGTSLTVTHDMDWAEFTSITAYRHQKSTILFDQEGTPAPIMDAGMHERAETLQQELLITGSSGALDWTLGTFLFQSEAAYRPLTIRSVAMPSQNYDNVSPQDLTSMAVYGQGTFAITDRTSVTAGLRYTEDKRRINSKNIARAANPIADGTVLVSQKAEKTYREPTWRLSLDHKLDDAILLYVSYNRGFKSGLYNGTSVGDAPVEPEIVDAYEIGVKSEFFDRSLRVNVAAFDYNYDEVQLIRLDQGRSVLLNAAEGKIRGFEIETTFVPSVAVGQLEINASLAYLDTEYSSFPNGPQTTPLPGGGNVTVPRDLSGNAMVQAPDWTGSLAVNYSLPVYRGELGFSLSYYYNAGFYWEVDNRIEQPNYELLNGQVYYAFGADQQYRVRLFGKNLTDSEYYSYVSGGAFGDQGAPAAPRTYGVGLDLTF